MDKHDERFEVPEGTLIQLPSVDGAEWMRQQLATSAAFRILHAHFAAEGLKFHLERSKVFVSYGRDPKNKPVPHVLGILPSFVPATAADSGHPAVGISVHDSGYALATGVSVSHRPFGVTDFTLYEVVPGTRKIASSKLSAEEINKESLATLASRLHRPSVPRGRAKGSKGAPTALSRFTVVDSGDQGLLIGTVIRQLLADKYSKGLFPPEYATAISQQTPTLQKFAFAASQRFNGTLLSITLCTSSSTSSNVCTSTSTSSVEL